MECDICLRSRKRGVTRGSPCYPRHRCLPAETVLLLGCPSRAGLVHSAGRSWPLPCCSDTRASHQPQLQKLWREAQSRKQERGFRRRRGCGGDLRVATDPAPAVSGGQHHTPNSSDLQHGVSAMKCKDGLAPVLAPRLLEERR